MSDIDADDRLPPLPSSPEPLARRRRRFSIWTIVAPIALLAAVSVIVVIARGAGWVGKPATTATADGTTTTRTTAKHHKPARGHGGASAGATRIFYTIRTGDTLEAVAIRYGTTIARLQALNPKVNPENLQVGERIRIR